MSRERTRRRWRMIWRGVLALVAAAVFAGIGYSSYRAGSLLARLDVTALQADVDRLTGDLQTLRAENARLQGDLAQTRQTADALRRRYDTDVPSGGLAALVDLVRQRLRDGLPQDRIAHVLREAASMRSCDGPAIRKRFAIQPAGPTATDDGVTLLDGLIRVTATAPAAAAEPAKAATVTILRGWSAEPIRLTGLPARQAITINNAELQLVVETSNVPGYAAVSLSTCGNG
jgi:cell division protein FtsB